MFSPVSYIDCCCKHNSNRSFPLSRLNVFWPRQTLRLGQTVAYCTLGRVRGWFLLSASDPWTKGSPTMTDSQGTVCYATGWADRGLRGACRVDGWSIFFSIKGIHKVDDFRVRIWHNGGPISSRLATYQLSPNFHWEGQACGGCGDCPEGAQFGRITSTARRHRVLHGCFFWVEPVCECFTTEKNSG